MNNSERTRELLTKHCQRYPKLQIRDVFKFLHQSTFGCEHLVSSLETATQYISKEYADIHHEGEEEIEVLDGAYSRVHLSYLDKGLTANTLAKLFVASSKKEKESSCELLFKLGVAKELIREGTLPFSEDEFDKAVSEWQEKDFCAIHHSDIFRENYHPSYRVISNDYIPFLPLFAEVDKRLTKGKITIAVEGSSASGKSTLSDLLYDIYGCSVFHMDDFFLRPEQRTPQRFAQVGGNIDHERFLSEVLEPLSKGENVTYRKFLCSSMTLGEEERVIPKELVIVEGAYSMHPELAKFYDFSVFLDISEQLQRERILHRNSPQMAQRFFTQWIPLEKTYFEKTDIRNRCDMIIKI